MFWRLSIRPLMRGRAAALFVLGLLLVLLQGQAAWSQDFLPVNKAFQVQASAGPKGEFVVEFDMAPQIHLYRDRLLFQGLPAQVKVTPPELPPGTRQYDEGFGKEVEVYRGLLTARMPLAATTPVGQPAYVQVGYQGCADAGLCYPPQTRYFRLTVAEGGKVAAVAPATAEEATAGAGGARSSAVAQAVPASANTVSSGHSRIDDALASGNLLLIAGVFLVAGLALSLTPCVLPMLPILSSIIVGEGEQVSRWRGFTLALSYSQGMALVYTALGVAAGLLGEGLAATLQNPWVLSAFGLLLVLFSLSMFGAYELQVPSFIQSRLTHRSGQLKGGNLVGVFIMGLLSALIVGPCVTGPLAGALVYISQTRNVVLGGVALYALALGMSVPLLLLGISAGAWLPKAGAWMTSVKTLFGMLLLGVAWWLVSPILPPGLLLGLAGAWLALGGAMLGAFDHLGAQASVKHRAAKALGWVMLVLAAFELVGAVTGATRVLAPLSELKGSALTQAEAPGRGKLPFKRVTTPAELDAALAEAAAKGRIAMLDFYADWCVSCKEMELLTFTDPRVLDKLARASLIQADVTDANAAGERGEAAKALLKRFGLFGPPGIIFFDARGQEQVHIRVIGFQKADAFVQQLQAAGL